MPPEDSTPSFTFLVLADIHFGKFANSREFGLNQNTSGYASSKRLSSVDSLITTILKLEDKPTAILVPGDLTSIASPSEFEGCIKLTIEIAKKLDISSDNIFFTYGNHDVDWRICALKNETAGFSTDHNYNHVAAMVGSLYTPVKNRIKEGPVPGSGVFRTEDHTIFILNSGFYCVADQIYRHGSLGSEQLKWFEEVLKQYSSDTGWKILMVHHHPHNYKYPTPINDISCIEEGAEVVNLAGHYGVDLVCHGHRHHPRLFTEMETNWKKPMTFICAGSVAVNALHRDNGLIPNLFHVVSLRKRLANKAAFGKVTSFEFTTEGWKPVSYKEATPLDHVHHFGALVSDCEADEAAKSFLLSIISSLEVKSTELPAMRDLPDALLCCSLEQLNNRLSRLAQGSGYLMYGKYPDSVMIQSTT